VVYEASAPLRATSIESFQSRSLRGTFMARRPKVALDAAALAAARRYAENQLGRPYDFRFLWNDETLYCSEFVWKAYEMAGVTLCPTRRFSDYNLHAPAVARVIKERYGSADRLPGEEPVISPGDLAASDMLIEAPRAESAGH
jgi:cell wall-associated NlpC family hydrolase